MVLHLSIEKLQKQLCFIAGIQNVAGDTKFPLMSVDLSHCYMLIDFIEFAIVILPEFNINHNLENIIHCYKLLKHILSSHCLHMSVTMKVIVLSDSAVVSFTLILDY